jgi:hypothetical protein
MRIQTLLLFALLSPTGSVLAQTPAAPSRHSASQVVNPVGTYDVSFVRNGEASTGVLTISGDQGSLKGSLEAHGHTIPLTTVTVAGRIVTLRDVSDLSITLTLADGDTVRGKWSGHGDSGEFTGTRRQH